jgi:hypothetical protein
MRDIKYMKLRTKNAKMMQMYGDKLTASEWLRKARTNGLHTDLQHSSRYGGISNSCTLSDGCGGGRFKMIGYSHPYRWSTLYLPCTAEQEARVFKKGCEMADARYFLKYDFNEALDLWQDIAINDCVYGPNHVKYDKGAAFFSFISKRNIWKPSKVKMICNRYCAELLLEVWPDMLDIKKELKSFTGETCHPTKRLDPAQLTPDQLEYQASYYFRSSNDPTQAEAPPAQG